MYREVTNGDHAWIYATYLRHNWFKKDNNTTLKRKTWSSLQHARIEQIIANGGVFIACTDEDPDYIVGYAFKDGEHPFVYIRLSFREGYGTDVTNNLLKGL